MNYHPRDWFHRHKKLAIILSAVLVVVIAGGVAAGLYMFNHKAAPKPVAKPIATKPAVKPKPVIYYSPLDGTQVANQAATTAPVTAIMIENSPDARPQSGLKSAQVVFEAIAEGGITRFMALYQQSKPQLIGPVRSVRPYFLSWVTPFNASIAHVGGSYQALQTVRNGTFRDIDEFFNGGSYWRATDRYAPHNMYTSFANLDALNASKGYTSSTPVPFDRKDSTAAKPTATSINVTISGAWYNSSYAYNATTNTYDRSEGGAPHMDREDGQISPRVVVVLDVNEQTQMQDGYREVIGTVGTGQAWIFQDGTEQTVTWHKDSDAGQLYFTDSTGAHVALARGQTWITAVPGNEGGGVTWQ